MGWKDEKPRVWDNLTWFVSLEKHKYQTKFQKSHLYKFLQGYISCLHAKFQFISFKSEGGIWSERLMNQLSSEKPSYLSFQTKFQNSFESM